MIQRTDSIPSGRQEEPTVWGKWSGMRHYSLEVVQHPIRARMCGFGDKDRRPLAPAAVAKMIVRREDDSIVDLDEVDISFFLVTVDLWSGDGKRDMNLVLHPSSADRYQASAHTAQTKQKRRGASASTPAPRTSGHQTPARKPSPPPGSQSAQSHPVGSHTSPPPPYSSQGYPSAEYPHGAPYGPPPSDPSGTWGYPPPPVDRSASFPPPILPSIHTFARTASSSSSEAWTSQEQPPESDPYRAWNSDYGGGSHDPPIRTPASDARDGSIWSQPPSSIPPSATTEPSEASPSHYGHPPFHQGSTQPTYGQYTSNPVNPSVMAGHVVSGASSSVLPRQSYTRTLVGPLSANASRLLDEHRKPGIFFLFQDLSIRTEGTFRLRMRLMNVGAPPAPEMGASRVHNDVSPVLAQVYTDAFTVYSAKRFPGVPDTTALSIAFGNQGQKLPLRNRHGSATKRRRRGNSESDDDSDA